jgi:hypothetical protein
MFSAYSRHPFDKGKIGGPWEWQNGITLIEMGVRHGRSLAMAGCRAIGIDPGPEIIIRDFSVN